MKTVNLKQGSPEWHAHRMQHFNASDAPAMMGVSPYKTRAALIRELATGLTEEVSAGTQRLFDDGHRTEALARPIAEAIICEDLSPVVGTNGRLSASYDGLTFLYDKGFECKRLNKRLREAMVPGCTGADLPMDYQVQMEHQHAVNEDCEKTLFIAAEFDADGNLVEERHCWYTPNLELRAQILAGWDQLEADVAAYKPAEVAPVVVAEPVEALPAVLVKVSGEISITANFAAFQVRLQDFLDHHLIREPKTDTDFATLDGQIKAMKGAEAALESAEAQMLAQIQSVDAAKKTKDMLHKLVRDNRLMAEKLLASEKERRKAEIVTKAQAALREHIAALSKRVGVTMPLIEADIAGATKGLKSLASMEDKVGAELVRAKIEANRVADLIDQNRRTIDSLAGGYTGMFPDLQSIVLKSPEDCEATVRLRIDAHEKRMQAERERIRAEEAARLEREQREEAERQARIEADARAAADLLEAALIQRQAQNSEAQAPQQVLKAEPVTADATARGEPAIASPVGGPTGAGQPAAAGPVGGVVPLRAAAPAQPQAAQYTVRLGEIQARLAPIQVTAEGLAQLGFPCRSERGLKLYMPSDFTEICERISAHVLALAAEAKKAA